MIKSLIAITLVILTIDSTPSPVAKGSIIRRVAIVPRVTIIKIEIILDADTVPVRFSLFKGIKIKTWEDRLSIGLWCL